MSRVKVRHIAVTALSLIALTVSASQANFADDWVSGAMTNTTAPAYYKGAQRGYFTGGGFSARWPQSNDNLLTVTPPSIKAGCGGIDMMWGGFSFLNADMLMKKLQNILSAAPAAAFDIALKTLAPQVSETIKAMNSIVDKLNHLSLDDCKAAKALVTMAPNPFGAEHQDAYKAEKTTSQADFMISSGLTTDWSQEMTRLQNSFNKPPTDGSKSAARKTSEESVAACPAPLKNIFSGGSILERLGEAKGIPSSHIASIRAFIGDVYIETPAMTGQTYDSYYLAPCGDNSFDSMVDGTAKIADTEGGCKANTDANRNLIQYVASRMTTIAGKIKTRSDLTATDVSFMQSIPLPIFPALRAGVQTQSEDMIIGKLSAIAAKGMAFQMMTDMATRIYQLNDYSNHLQTTQKSPGTGCQIAQFSGAFAALKEIINRAGARTKEAQDSYMNEATNSAAVESLVASLEKFNTTVKQQMTTRFGAGPANRVAGMF